MSEKKVHGIDETQGKQEEMDCNAMDDSQISAPMSVESEISEEAPNQMATGIGETRGKEEELNSNGFGYFEITASRTSLEYEISKQLLKLMGTGICETQGKEEELDCNPETVLLESEILEEAPKPMAGCSEETLKNKENDTDIERKFRRLKEGLKKTAERHGMILSKVVPYKWVIVSENSSSLSANNLEKSTETSASNSKEYLEGVRLHPCKPTSSRSLMIQDVQQTFEEHGLTLENPTLHRLVHVDATVSSSGPENTDEESVDLPNQLAKRSGNPRLYIVEGTFKDANRQLPGPSGTNPSCSKASDDRAVSSSESETHEEQK